MKNMRRWLLIGGIFSLSLWTANIGLAVEKKAPGFAPLPQTESKEVSDFSPLVRFETVGLLVQEKCMACHTRNLKLPFYSRIPGVKDTIERDYKDGLRAMDLRTELVDAEKGGPVSEVVLAKMEWVIQNNTMPPRSLPWSTGAAR